LLLGQAALPVKVLLEELNVGLLMGLILEELLVGGLVHGGRLHVYMSSVSWDR
jgi:hypothetical protein